MKHIRKLKDNAFMQQLIEQARPLADDIDVVFGIEPHGFIVGSLLAYNLGKGFVPIRKKGKLPADVVHITISDTSAPYSLLEMHKDALVPEQRVLLVDSTPTSTRLITAITAQLRTQNNNTPHLFVLSDEHLRLPETSDLQLTVAQ